MLSQFALLAIWHERVCYTVLPCLQRSQLAPVIMSKLELEQEALRKMISTVDDVVTSTCTVVYRQKYGPVLQVTCS